MSRSYRLAALHCGLSLVAGPALADEGGIEDFVPVTQDMLENPAPEDWLMFSRTFDAQRFSPLDQINRQNVHDLRMVWSRGMPDGQAQGIPLAYRGVLYLLAPGDRIQAVDGTNGDLIWSYERPLTAGQQALARAKSIAIYDDLIFHATADNYIIALDAKTGELRWETQVEGGGSHTSGVYVVNGIIVSGRTCRNSRDSCFTAAHDAKTGKALWRFQHVPAMGEPGSETWGESPDHERNMASTWGLAGSYDPERNLLLWGIANPMPNTRMNRHGGNYAGTGFKAPADLYSNSTVALVPETGELKWYYQHLPGDDWDLDYTNERILVHTRIDPNPEQVRWYNEAARGQERDVAIVVGEGGGIFVIGRDEGKFLWAKPFPFETEHFLLSDIDPETGATHINRDLVLKEPGDHHIVCYWNTTSFWPSAYSLRTNSVYVPYIDNCLDMTAAEGENPERRRGILRPGHDPEKVAGLAKVNIETGETVYFGEQSSPSTAGVLATAGGVVFHGDTHRRFRAYDDETGEILWETIVGGPASVGIITYAVDGRQYVAMHTGDVLATAGTARQTGIEHLARQNILYVFALPE